MAFLLLRALLRCGSCFVLGCWVHIEVGGLMIHLLNPQQNLSISDTYTMLFCLFVVGRGVGPVLKELTRRMIQFF
jgi:hypothetical protein